MSRYNFAQKTRRAIDKKMTYSWRNRIFCLTFLFLLLCAFAVTIAYAETSIFILKFGSYGSGDAQFINPERVAIDSSGNLYVADFGNNRVQKFTSDGFFITKWGSQGSGDGQFINPIGIAVDKSGNIYVADRNNARVQKFTSDDF